MLSSILACDNFVLDVFSKRLRHELSFRLLIIIVGIFIVTLRHITRLIIELFSELFICSTENAVTDFALGCLSSFQVFIERQISINALTSPVTLFVS